MEVRPEVAILPWQQKPDPNKFTKPDGSGRRTHTTVLKFRVKQTLLDQALFTDKVVDILMPYGIQKLIFPFFLEGILLRYD